MRRQLSFETLPPPAPKPEFRTCWVGAPEIFALEQACDFVNKAFGEMCYLVGSATRKRDFRDVDVRMIMPDAKFDILFGDKSNANIIPFWSLICTSISEYLQNRTRLKVDFQIQRQSEANHFYKDGIRDPLGMFPVNVGPDWRNIGYGDEAELVIKDKA